VRKRVLVVEDDLELVELLTFNLAKTGLSVIVATDGGQALQKARTQRPDVVLLDLMLPELDGLAVCEILRRDRGTRRIPIIIMTATSGQLARVAALAAGANDYVTKPFPIKGMLERIDVILSQSPSPCPSE
jgi:two-component system, OmpR family, alkaline phosphatase synthesis response regulator PhoP